MILENVSQEIERNYQMENLKKNPFFFKRQEYAKEISNALLNQGVNSISFFQIRRKGKTSFLLNDLAAQASKDFYVFYFSFMKNQNVNLKNNINFENSKNQKLSFLFKKELLEFVYVTICKNKLSTITTPEATNFFKKIGFKFLTIGVEFEKQKEMLNYEQIELSEIFKLIADYTDKPVLLLLDEFQELAKHTENIGFLRDLRTELDVRKNYVSSVFTGSSYNELQKFFGSYNNPFFAFSLDLSFEDLGKEFTDFCCDQFEKITKIKLDKENLFKQFEQTGKIPMIITQALNQILINKKYEDLNFFIKNNLIYKENNENQRIWKELSVLEKFVVYVISRDNSKITKKENKDLYKRLFNKEINDNKLIYTIKKLKEKDFIYKDKQNWFFTNNSFNNFILTEIQEEDLLN